MRVFHWKNGELVSEASRGQVRIERGDIDALEYSERVALIAQYSVGEAQPRSLSRYLEELARNDFLPVVISVAPCTGKLEFPHGLPEQTIIMRRPNIGYDFGSWATALGVLPRVREKSVVLLTNDSMLGPFAPLAEILSWAAQPGIPDIRALTSSYQFARHLQSYFLCFRGGILADDPWVEFFNSIRVQPGKDDVVLQYELGVSRLAFAEGYSTEEFVAGPDLGVPYGNPTIDGWKKMLDWGVPMLKRTIMTHPATEQEGAEARAYIARKFGENISEW
ncbi:Rhamnan synthesis protein F [Actinobaculum suis]|uniref:Rhamnan synthesis F family protein n=1 Tax=Actinobaculum suis TaxID=1657 RepID=A0A1G7DN86_9ACTO|nr:rhamnan synthesis F family protein [Actinobaculum suis]MDY5153520.1 rhamnan synthesis F family protein [Actinobaculum suis]SDE52590.1 Rhamnan synthesis protein F [Actinobaculum suis]VDG75931.1 Rhamnan synthesis protein F [Actinobaculum suis]